MIFYNAHEVTLLFTAIYKLTILHYIKGLPFKQVQIRTFS